MRFSVSYVRRTIRRCPSATGRYVPWPRARCATRTSAAMATSRARRPRSMGAACMLSEKIIDETAEQAVTERFGGATLACNESEDRSEETSVESTRGVGTTSAWRFLIQQYGQHRLSVACRIGVFLAASQRNAVLESSRKRHHVSALRQTPSHRAWRPGLHLYTSAHASRSMCV